MTDYIQWIRSKVGNDPIFLNVSGACVFDEAGRILLQKRSADDEIWGFPGGAMELGESAEEAAIREVREETGLDIKINHLIGVYTKYWHTYPNGDKAQPVAFLFQASVVNGNLKIDNQETFELRFFEREELPKLFNPQHCDGLADVLAGRRGVYR